MQKHHFIPEYYLRGFCDQNGLIYSFNKKTARVDLAGKSPGAVFYERDLHTLVLDETKDFFIETALSTIEDQCGQFITELSHVSNEELSSARNIAEVCNICMLCLYLQFWRLPSNAALAISTSERLLDIYGERDPSGDLMGLLDFETLVGLYENRFDENARKIIQFLILPIIVPKYDGKFPQGFSLRRVDEGCELISSDRPIAFDDFDPIMSFGEEVYFPMSRHIILMRERGSGFCFEDVQRKIADNAEEKYFGSSVDLIKKYGHL